MFDLARLTASGLVAQIDYHESIGSTNDRALAIGARSDTASPLLVLAEQQSAGRGRGANRWRTTAGALTFSLVLEAPPARLPAHRWPHIALLAGVSVCDALQCVTPRAQVQVKWPNDVYLNGRKICGILSESIPGCRDRLVVGIGVNVNNRIQESGISVQEADSNTTHHAPLTTHSDLTTTAISLIDCDGLTRDLTDVLLSVLDQFDCRWQELLEGRFDLTVAAYRARCLLTGKTVALQQPGGNTMVGVCNGIDDFGRMRLQTPDGPQTIVSATVLRWDN